MAVQAQHPSSVFFLNSNGQETNDWSLQTPDSHFTFIKAGLFLFPKIFSLKKKKRFLFKYPLIISVFEIDSRKRSGEVSSPMIPPRPKPAQVSSFPLLPGDLAGEIKRQRDDLDVLLQTQGEELRRTLTESRDRCYVELLCATEELVGPRVREKEAELEKATRRHAELEARAAKLAEEVRTWQVRAATREAEASSLQARLHQAIASQATPAKQSTVGGGDTVDAESVYVDPKRIDWSDLVVGFADGNGIALSTSCSL